LTFTEDFASVGYMSKQKTVLVLVIENREDLREVYTEIFNFEHYKVVTAASKSEALEKLKQGGWDVVLLDMLYSGGINGLQLLEANKRDPAYIQAKKRPILLAIVDDEDTTEKVRSLVDEVFIMGSFTPGEVLQRVHEYLQQRWKLPAAAVAS
jgi:CheY-like chemotaxis protein